MTQNRENALETELVRVYALLHSLSDLIRDHAAAGQPISADFVSDRVQNTLIGLPAPADYEKRARETLNALAGAPGAPEPEKPEEIAPGSVWRDTESEEWAEYVILRTAEGKGRLFAGNLLCPDVPLSAISFVVYKRLLYGGTDQWFVRSTASFRQRFRRVHGPVGPTTGGSTTPATAG